MTAMISQAEKLLKPDARSDPAVLDGLTLEQVRQLYHDGTGSPPMNRQGWRSFMIADTELLVNPDSGVIKCVAACGLRRRCLRAEESALWPAAIL
jgi:hypothetical protein